MSQPRPAPLPTKHPLYLARNKNDGAPIAIGEARDDEQAAVRVTYVVGHLGLSEWQEVEVQRAAGYVSRVPTFLDGFFHASRMQRTAH